MDCEHKLNWENALVNSIGKKLFASPNQGLVNILQQTDRKVDMAEIHVDSEKDSLARDQRSRQTSWK